MRAGIPKIVLGTRGSELALAQAHLVETAVHAVRPDLQIDTRTIVTKGDRTKDVDVRAGWKGLFTAEIERALMLGEVDLAVHSAKDLPSQTNPSAQIAAVLPRAPIEDVLVRKHSGRLSKNATVATSSIRRKHQLRWKWPDISIVDLRGNVPTRLRKLAENDWDAIVLARAGLERLGPSLAQEFFVEILSPDIFLPAGGQGIVAIQIRAGDERVRSIVDLVNDPDTLLCLRAERDFLRLLNVDCNAPVGVLAWIDNGMMRMRAQFFDGESGAPREAEIEGKPDDGERVARELWRRLRA